MRLGDLSVGFVECLADAVRSYGQDPLPLLDQYGLDPARLAQPLARLSIPRYMRLGHAAIALTGDPALGLRMGQLSKLSQAGLAGVTAAQAPTVREAARTLIRFEALYHPSSVRIRSMTWPNRTPSSTADSGERSARA